MSKINVLISFDNTASMTFCLDQVRRNIVQILHNLFTIPDISVGLISHLDYFNGDDAIKSIDFTTNKQRLIDFCNNAPHIGNQDNDECYELVLHRAREASWTGGAKKILILIGDCNPHSKGDFTGGVRCELDWKNEAKLLADLGVQIYAVHAMGNYFSQNFYQSLASITNGLYIPLQQLMNCVPMITASCYAQESTKRVEQYEDEIVKAGKMNRDLDSVFNKILHRDSKGRFCKSVKDLGAVEDGRFQVLEVPADVKISDFVRSQGLAFKEGSGYYEFTKREEIQGYKKIILQERSSGDLFEGARAREIVGLPEGVSVKMSPTMLSQYRVFVQSTSNNRKLIGGTLFLYEVQR